MRSGADPVDTCKGMLAQKKKIPGFGHRVYHTEDPRATHLRHDVARLGQFQRASRSGLSISHKIEEFVKADKKLNANVDFYSASTYHTLGIDVDLFTPIFAVSRISGWTAHVIEQLRRQSPDPPARGIYRARNIPANTSRLNSDRRSYSSRRVASTWKVRRIPMSRKSAIMGTTILGAELS